MKRKYEIVLTADYGNGNIKKFTKEINPENVKNLINLISEGNYTIFQSRLNEITLQCFYKDKATSLFFHQNDLMKIAELLIRFNLELTENKQKNDLFSQKTERGKPILDIDLSTRTRNSLILNNILYVGDIQNNYNDYEDIMNYNRIFFLTLKNFGKKSLQELVEKGYLKLNHQHQQWYDKFFNK